MIADPRVRRCRIWVIALLLMCAADSAAQTTPRYVLFVNSFEQRFAPQNVFADAFRAELTRRSPEPVYFLEISLPTQSKGRGPVEEPTLNYLSSVFGGRRIDLVVPMGGTAATFAQTFRQQLFPTAPMLLASVDQ